MLGNNLISIYNILIWVYMSNINATNSNFVPIIGYGNKEYPYCIIKSYRGLL